MEATIVATNVMVVFLRVITPSPPLAIATTPMCPPPLPLIAMLLLHKLRQW